jgi:hypothetical protein
MHPNNKITDHNIKNKTTSQNPNSIKGINHKKCTMLCDYQFHAVDQNSWNKALIRDRWNLELVSFRIYYSFFFISNLIIIKSIRFPKYTGNIQKKTPSFYTLWKNKTPKLQLKCFYLKLLAVTFTCLHEIFNESTNSILEVLCHLAVNQNLITMDWKLNCVWP